MNMGRSIYALELKFWTHAKQKGEWIVNIETGMTIVDLLLTSLP